MENLSEKISKTLQQKGASLVGFADITELPSTMRKDFPRAISIAVALNPHIVNEIGKGPTKKYYNEYLRVNTLLSNLCKVASEVIEQNGNSSYSIEPTTEEFDPVTISAPFQHKTVATRAGIGWIGKSALLITRQFGAAIRLATVLTDAELVHGTPIDNSYCRACDECVSYCPAHAIAGRNWYAGLERDRILNASLCRKKCRELSQKESIPSTICGICINVCPWTRKYLKKTF